MMNQNAYWYVLFTRTGQEEKAEQILKRQLGSDDFTPFIPMLQTIFRHQGQIKKELGPLFPGYVFIESKMTSIEIMERTRNIISTSKDFVRFLQYGDTGDIAMRDHERNVLLSLCNNEGCIELSRGIIEGARIYIKEGPLKGFESIIKKVNRHKRQAVICLSFMGEERLVRVALEIVEKR